MAGPDGANARRAVEAGADAIVAGTTIFGAAGYAEAIGRLRSARLPAP
jgi:pentose-5-phosphate-3-epimerase